MSKSKSTKREGGDNSLSFLDIMACGLGAVILIFLIIEHNIDSGGSAEAEVLMEKMETMQQQLQQMQVQVEDIAKRNAEEEKLGDDLQKQQQSTQTALAAVDDQMTAQEEQRKQLNQSNKALADKVAQSVVQAPSTGNEKYLMGLSIEGKHNAILIDYSASMTDEKVLDIITWKIGPASARSAAPKWARAKKTVKWMIDRLPPDSTGVVVAFNEQAQVLGGINSFARTDPQKITDVIAALEGLDPQNGTNLQVAFETAFSLSPKPTNYYLITDGLPTRGGKGAPSCEQNGAVTGLCRVRHMNHVANIVQRGIGSGSLNVVLLPLEGDWYAPKHYWTLAGRTGGLTISPAGSWP